MSKGISHFKDDRNRSRSGRNGSTALYMFDRCGNGNGRVSDNVGVVSTGKKAGLSNAHHNQLGIVIVDQAIVLLTVVSSGTVNDDRVVYGNRNGRLRTVRLFGVR